VLEEDGEAAMTTATSTFFANLAARGHDPVLGSAKGTVRIDLAQGSSIDSWWVRIDDGSIEVSHDEGGADCIVRTTPEAFDQLASGHTGAVAAPHRGGREVAGAPRRLGGIPRRFTAPTGMPKASGARTAGKRRG
jgi:hypothetical protein